MANRSVIQTTEQQKEREPLRGYVADILNGREAVINLGSNHGVVKGMRFAILEVIEHEIKDPNSGEVLGLLPPQPKIRVEVVQVLDKMSIVRTYEMARRNIGGTGQTIADAFGLSSVLYSPPTKYIEEPRTFRVGSTSDTFYSQHRPEDSIVRVGDPVVQIFEND